MKVEFDDGLINFRILFLKAEKVSKFLNFNSKLFHSMTVYTEKNKKKLCLPLKGECYCQLLLYALFIEKQLKKVMFTTGEGNVIINCYYMLY